MQYRMHAASCLQNPNKSKNILLSKVSGAECDCIKDAGESCRSLHVGKRGGILLLFMIWVG